MKIEMKLGTEKIIGDSTVSSVMKPSLWVAVEMSEEELHSLGKKQGAFIESLSRLINFSIQHME